jgi:plastocyanin
MARRVLPLAFVLALVAAACAKSNEATIGFGSGTQFVPQVADSQDDVGLFPSVAVTADGQPYVAYYGFPEELAKDEVAVPRPVGSPSVPSVLLTSVNDGVWTRGAVAMEKDIPSVTIAYGPAAVPEIASAKPENVDGTAIALGSDGALHVAWVSNTGVWYAHNMDGTSFTASQIEKAKIDERGPISQPSIALDGQGAPWIAYAKTTAKGQDVIVATQSGTSWSTDTIATVPLRAGGAQPGRVAIATTKDGSPVVLFSDGSGVQAASNDGENGWTTSPVEAGVDGPGLSATTDGDGTVHAAYYANDEIHAATSSDGTGWRTATVSSVGTGDNDEGRSTGIGVDSEGTTYVTWYDPGTDEVRLASSSDAGFSAIQTGGTTAGDLPTLAVNGQGTVYVAWYDETEQNLMLGEYGDVGDLEFAVQSPTPTGPSPTAAASSAPPENCTTAQNGELTLVAQGIAFDTNCIEIPAGQKVTIHFDNKDSGTPHNLAVYPSADQTTDPLFRGDPVTGPDTVDYEVGPLDAGDVYFQCDIHPTMNGTFRVVAARGGGGGSNGGGGGNGGSNGGGGTTPTTVTAQNIAFDTDEIDLVAGQAAKLTFDNEDAGTPHNIAIYPSESDISADSALFQGDLVTGPAKQVYDIPALKAGTYYFHCDVHPTMNGSVVVSG